MNSTSAGFPSTNMSTVCLPFFGPVREIQSREKSTQWTRAGFPAWLAGLCELAAPLLPPEDEEPVLPSLPPPVPLLPLPPLLPPTGRVGFETGGTAAGGAFGTGTAGTCGGRGAGGTGGSGGTVTGGTGGSGGTGASAPAEVTQPAKSPATSRTTLIDRRRSRDLTICTTPPG